MGSTNRDDNFGSSTGRPEGGLGSSNREDTLGSSNNRRENYGSSNRDDNFGSTNTGASGRDHYGSSTRDDNLGSSGRDNNTHGSSNRDNTLSSTTGGTSGRDQAYGSSGVGSDSYEVSLHSLLTTLPFINYSISPKPDTTLPPHNLDKSCHNEQDSRTHSSLSQHETNHAQ